jgi:hypothetical protein
MSSTKHHDQSSPGCSGGVTVGRVVAAADVPALEADPQVQPRLALRQALFAAVDGLGQLRDLDVIEMGAGWHRIYPFTRPLQQARPVVDD